MNRLFKIYNLRDIKKNKLKFVFIILAFAVSISLLSLSMFLYENKEENLKRNAVFLNHGDISVVSRPFNPGQKEYEIFKNYISDIKKYKNVDIITEAFDYYYVKKSNLKDLVAVRFIDYKNIGIFTNKNTDTSGIIISKPLADSLKVKKSGKIKIIFNKDTIKEFSVGDIVSQNEINTDFGTKYIFMDKSEIFKILSENRSTKNNKFLISPEDTLYKKIYLRNTRNNYNEILEKTKKTFDTTNERGNKIIWTAEDIRKNFSDAYSNVSDVLYFFTLISFIITGPGFASLIFLRIKNNIKDYSVFRVLGMKKSGFINLVIRECLLFSIVSNIAGIISGFFLFKYVSVLLMGMEPDFVMMNSIIVVSLKVFLFSSLIIVVHGIAAANFISNIDPVQILRNREHETKTFKSLFFSFAAVIICYYLIFNIITNSLSLQYLLGSIFFIVILYLIIKGLMLLLPLNIIKLKHLKLAINNLKKNNSGAAVLVTTFAVCTIVMFAVINLRYGLYDSVNKHFETHANYNTTAYALSSFQESFETDLNKLGIKNFFYSLNVDSSIGNKKYITKIFDKRADIPGFNETGIVISGYVARKNKYKTGDIVEIIIDKQKYNLKVADILYSNDNLNPVYLNGDIFISEKILNPVHKDFPEYYMNLSKSEKEKVFNLEEKYFDLDVDEPVNIVNLFLMNFQKYLQIIDIVAVLFIFSSLFLLSNITLILITKRKKNLVLLRVLGAKKHNVHFMIIFENIIIGLLGSIIGIILTNFAMDFFIKSFIGFEFYANYGIIAIELVSMSLLIWLITSVSIKNMKFDDYPELLRQK